MLTPAERSECIKETLQDLQEDATLLQLTLMGAHASIDKLTLSCLLRLTDYLKQHVDDICVICRRES